MEVGGSEEGQKGTQGGEQRSPRHHPLGLFFSFSSPEVDDHFHYILVVPEHSCPVQTSETARSGPVPEDTLTRTLPSEQRLSMPGCSEASVKAC